MTREILTNGGTEIFKLTPARCNIFIVRRNSRSIIIDSGISFDRGRIESALQRREIVPEALILTHTHFDHAGNAAWLAGEYGLEVVVQAGEYDTLAQGDTPIPKGTYLVTKGVVGLGRQIQSAFRYDNCQADHLFSEKFDLERYGLNGYVIHTPGHSPGGATIVIDNEIAVAGDAIIGTIPGAPFPPFADDVDELIRSWGKILDTGCSLFLPGHGQPVTREDLKAELERRSQGDR